MNPRQAESLVSLIHTGDVPYAHALATVGEAKADLLADALNAMRRRDDLLSGAWDPADVLGCDYSAHTRLHDAALAQLEDDLAAALDALRGRRLRSVAG